MLDVLVYFFDNYVRDDLCSLLGREGLSTELELAGFSKPDVNSAMGWLQELVAIKQAGYVAPTSESIRILCFEETVRFSEEAYGHFVFLCQAGVLTPEIRETVLDRAMALETEEVSLEQLRLVILMVLYNEGDYQHTWFWLQEIAFTEGQVVLN